MAASPGHDDGRAAGEGGGERRRVVTWDQVLPRRPLRVLLVEQDDSTRQVVAALLRKCGYQVVALGDGLKAWDVMKQRCFDFDLVLSEVTMPSLSGIDLLSRIVEADECRNVPVVMMSSQDSIGVVLKCMHMGAVDFLVKPVRKNELRNLWQHVWRRHYAINQANVSENNAGSNHLTADDANESKSGEADNAQSLHLHISQETEVQSTEVVKAVANNVGSFSMEFREAPLVDDTATKEVHFLDVNSGKDKVVATNAESSWRMLEEAPMVLVAETEGTFCMNPKSVKVVEDVLEANNPILFPADRSSALFCTDRTAKTTEIKYHSRATDNTCKVHLHISGDLAEGEVMVPIRSSSSVAKCSSRDDLLHISPACFMIKGNNDLMPCQLLNSNLTNQPSSTYKIQEIKEQDIFSHSNTSAFLRYGDRNQPAVHKMSSSSPCLRNEEVANSARELYVQVNGISPSKQQSIVENASNHFVPLESCRVESRFVCPTNAMEHTSTSNSCAQQDSTSSQPEFVYMPVPIHFGTVPYQNFCAGYGAMMQPIFYSHSCFLQQDPMARDKISILDGSDPSNTSRAQRNAHNFNEFCLQEETQQLHHSKQFIREDRELADTFCTSFEPENRTASCNNDLQKASLCGGSGEMVDTTASTIVALESGNESGVQNFCSKGLESGLGSERQRREAALVKFRMKRKQRCFAKKVRYHSRKTLAELRPRVKGQFVSHKAPHQQ